MSPVFLITFSCALVLAVKVADGKRFGSIEASHDISDIISHQDRIASTSWQKWVNALIGPDKCFAAVIGSAENGGIWGWSGISQLDANQVKGLRDFVHGAKDLDGHLEVQFYVKPDPNQIFDLQQKFQFQGGDAQDGFHLRSSEAWGSVFTTTQAILIGFAPESRKGGCTNQLYQTKMYLVDRGF
eukprot:gnl/MRDRNA2_/MRDRNA2_119483_c0_seq1.p1 gnl/MRDRNA2_/MRDRNA2_119483_c0~~gnl/MRDRNA2_/MRDRNA2_119483_c0_seq1.p1  ORF type:complete len:205 (-),score=24.01 gnl/MRDRNA2_/MRDRNA2_119483_c0_seq1:53-607(-)